MSDNPSGFGQALKRLRQAAGLTQEQLAQRASMHKFGVAKLEQGLREPSWATVQALAKALSTNCLAFANAGEVQAPTPTDAKPGRPRKTSAKADGPSTAKKVVKKRKPKK